MPAPIATNAQMFVGEAPQRDIVRVGFWRRFTLIAEKPGTQSVAQQNAQATPMRDRKFAVAGELFGLDEPTQHGRRLDQFNLAVDQQGVGASRR